MLTAGNNQPLGVRESVFSPLFYLKRFLNTQIHCLLNLLTILIAKASLCPEGERNTL